MTFQLVLNQLDLVSNSSLLVPPLMLVNFRIILFLVLSIEDHGEDGWKLSSFIESIILYNPISSKL